MKLVSSILALAVFGQVVPALAVCALRRAKFLQNSLSNCFFFFFFFFDLQAVCCPRSVNGVNLSGGKAWATTGVVCNYGKNIKCYYVSSNFFLSPEIKMSHL